MAKKILINDDEFEAFEGLPHLAIVLYIKAIRPFMDYKTGITGWKRGISYQSMKEELYVEHERGRHKDKSGSPSRDALRNAVQSLVNIGLLTVIPADKKLVFKLNNATVNDSVSTMNPTSTPQTNPTSTPQAEPAPQQDLDAWRGDMNPTPETPMNPTPRVSGKNNITTTTNLNLKTNAPVETNVNQHVSGGGDFSLIFDNKLSETEKKAISNALPATSEENAQALLDELAGVMQTQDVKNKVSYFVGITKRFKSGDFVPTAGIAIADRRIQNQQQRSEAQARQKQANIPKEERNNKKATAEGRAAMKAAVKGVRIKKVNQ